MWNARLDEAKVGIKIAWRNNSDLTYADDTHPYGRKWRGTKESLEESERLKVSLKLNIQKTKIMASGPITSWQTDGKQWKQWEGFIFGALQNHCR